MEATVLSRCLRRCLLSAVLAAGSVVAIGQGIEPTVVSGNGQADIVSLSLVSDAETGNPAFESVVDCFSLSFSYVVPYEDSEMGTMRMGSVFQSKALAVGVQGEIVGRSDSSCAIVGGGVSHLFGRTVGVGIQCHYVSRKAPQGAKASACYLTAGLCFDPDGSWSFGLRVLNPTRSALSYGDRDERLPTTVSASLRWRARRYMAFAAEAEKSIGDDAVGRLAACFYPVGGLYLSFGYSSEGSKVCCGMGYDWAYVGVRGSVSRHEQLGVTAGLGVELHIGRSSGEEEKTSGR